jgi:hypothetical protein
MARIMPCCSNWSCITVSSFGHSDRPYTTRCSMMLNAVALRTHAGKHLLELRISQIIGGIKVFTMLMTLMK